MLLTLLSIYTFSLPPVQAHKGHCVGLIPDLFGAASFA